MIDWHLIVEHVYLLIRCRHPSSCLVTGYGIKNLAAVPSKGNS